MPTLVVSRDVLDLIEYVEGETIKDKLIGLVSADLARRLRECKRETRYSSLITRWKGVTC